MISWKFPLFSVSQEEEKIYKWGKERGMHQRKRVVDSKKKEKALKEEEEDWKMKLKKKKKKKKKKKIFKWGKERVMKKIRIWK